MLDVTIATITNTTFFVSHFTSKDHMFKQQLVPLDDALLF